MHAHSRARERGGGIRSFSVFRFHYICSAVCKYRCHRRRRRWLSHFADIVYHPFIHGLGNSKTSIEISAETKDCIVLSINCLWRPIDERRTMAQRDEEREGGMRWSEVAQTFYRNSKNQRDEHWTHVEAGRAHDKYIKSAQRIHSQWQWHYISFCVLTAVVVVVEPSNRRYWIVGCSFVWWWCLAAKHALNTYANPIALQMATR